MAAEHDGKPWASARHICDTLGIDWASQFPKLKSKSWACAALIPTHDSSGRKQEISMIDRHTLTMRLATIDTNLVNETARTKDCQRRNPRSHLLHQARPPHLRPRLGRLRGQSHAEARSNQLERTPTMHDDDIVVEECRITIRSGFNRHSEPVFQTQFDGEALHPHALGLLEITKDHIKEDITIRAEDEEED